MVPDMQIMFLWELATWWIELNNTPLMACSYVILLCPVIHGGPRSVTFHSYPQPDVKAWAPLASNFDNTQPTTIEEHRNIGEFV